MNLRMLVMEEVKGNLFAGDSYDTPADAKRCWADRLFLGSRWYFYWKNFMIFSRSGRCAKRGELDGEHQIFYSNQNIKLIEECGGRIHLRGLDKLRALNGRPVVLIGNHMSLLETAVFHAIIRPYMDFTFVIKAALLDVPHFGDIMRGIGAIDVGRDNPREDLKTVLTRGKETLDSGKSVIIFPQSTRSVVFDPSKFNSIGIKLAKNAGVPIVPFALKTDFLSNGKLVRDLGPINRDKDVWFEFADPVEVTGNGKEAQQSIIDFIQSRLACWNR